MKVRFGPAGIPLKCRGGTIKGIEYTAEEGLDAFEVEFVRGVRMKPEDAAKAGEVAREKDVLLSCHCPYWINCSPREEAKAEIAIRNILQTARAAQAMKAWIIVLHPGYYMGRKPGEAEKLALKTLERVLEAMGSEGIKGVCLGLETTGKRTQLGTLEEVIRMSAQLDNALPVVDFAHIHARNNGSLEKQGDYAEIFNRVEEELGPRVAKNLHCHFSEVEYTEKGERRHLRLGERGSPPFLPLAREIAERGASPTLISESPLLDVDALKMKEQLEALKK
jgi:deoxyribonuclease-4